MRRVIVFAALRLNSLRPPIPTAYAVGYRSTAALRLILCEGTYGSRCALQFCRRSAAVGFHSHPNPIHGKAKRD
jgi:hypothetical protein